MPCIRDHNLAQRTFLGSSFDTITLVADPKPTTSMRPAAAGKASMPSWILSRMVIEKEEDGHIERPPGLQLVKIRLAGHA